MISNINFGEKFAVVKIHVAPFNKPLNVLQTQLNHDIGANDKSTLSIVIDLKYKIVINFMQYSESHKLWNN